MGESVRVILEKRAGQMKPGDAFVLNAPYAGGTHIPDVTVVTPVFLEGRDVAAVLHGGARPPRDIGGITPGSMPPFSKHISEEGVLLDNVQLVREGIFLEDELTAILTHDATRCATSRRTSPTCAHRSPAATRARPNSPRWSSTSAARSSSPT